MLRQGKGWFQGSGMGHEALGVMGYLLREDDVVFPCYRDRALMLVRGISPYQMALDFLARDGASSQARNLPGHFSSGPLKVFSIASPTGSQCLPAAGAAWGFKNDGDGRIALCNIGDASTRQGEFYEAICFAVQENLPVVFVVEDNHYGISTSTAKLLPFRLKIFNDDLITHINGRDAFQVYDTVSSAVEKARSGGGPSLLWCEVDRLGSHTSADDQRVYRPVSELEEMQLRDPIRLYVERLIADGDLTDDVWKQMQEEVTVEIDQVYREADKVSFPSPSGVMDHLYGPAMEHTPIPLKPEGETETMVSAINRTFRAGLETYPKMVMFGEDIEDPKGGVFGFTKGLSTDFSGRVVNSPLAEATIIGTAVGLAATGYRPVFELQFVDFLTPGFNQLVSQVATLRWRSKGEWTCPMVLYAPYGAYLPGGGMWHSQSNDGWWAHIPGIGVAIPGTAEDAAGLFWSAFQYEDPSLILIPKHIFRARMTVKDYKPVPFGKARIAREGSDVTVVTWGNCLEIAAIAADRMMEGDGVSVEIIDLRTIVPCDWETVQKSLAKTGQLVVIHEDIITCGFGQAVISEMTSRADRFYTLLSPPQLVARPDVHVPFCPSLELDILPDVDDLVGAIRRTLE